MAARAKVLDGSPSHAVAHDQPDSWRPDTALGWRVLRWVLLAATIGLTLCAIALGARTTTSYAELARQVAAGDVDDVQVEGDTAAPDEGLTSIVLVQWRSGLVDHVVEVAQLGPGASDSTDGDLEPVRGSVVDDLRARSDSVEVAVTDGPFTTPVTSGPVRGWAVPGWVLLTGTLVWIGGLFLLVNGPRPWRATRWAWFWLLGLVPPLGLLGFLVLSGPARPIPRPRPRALPFTAGWAFLLVVLVDGLVSG